MFWNRKSEKPAPRYDAPTEFVPRIVVSSSMSIERGSCGWWPRDIDNAPGRPGTYVSLRAGTYRAQAVEMPGGGYVLCADTGVPLPSERIRVATIAEAQAAFEALVLKGLHEFAAIRMEPRYRP